MTSVALCLKWEKIGRSYYADAGRCSARVSRDKMGYWYVREVCGVRHVDGQRDFVSPEEAMAWGESVMFDVLSTAWAAMNRAWKSRPKVKRGKEAL